MTTQTRHTSIKFEGGFRANPNSRCAMILLAMPEYAQDTTQGRHRAIQKTIDAEHDSLIAALQAHSRHPELAFQEEQTAARLAKELRQAASPSRKDRGTGVVGVLKNGAGPTIMVRADMDASPS